MARDFRGELEELRLFGPVIEEGPGGAGCSLRGRLRQGGIRAGILLLLKQREKRYNATQERKAVS